MHTHPLAATGTNAACPVCGHRRDGACGHCHAELRALRSRYELRPGRGNAFVDLLRGLGDVGGAGFALIHERVFVGRLRLPVLGNLVAFVVLVAVGVLWLSRSARPRSPALGGCSTRCAKRPRRVVRPCGC